MPVDISLYGIAAVPIIISLVQVGKEAGMPGRFAPILSIGLGVALGIGQQYTLPHPLIVQGIVIGVAVGLSAAGTYSAVSKFSQPPPPPMPPAQPTPVPPAPPPLVTP